MRREIVVVGASAGGVEALRSMVRQFPPEMQAVVLVVLHIPPAAPSALAQILSRVGPLPAVAAQEGALLTPGRILVAVADHHMLVNQGHVTLSQGRSEHGHRPAIDALFRSAAQVYGPRVIGVILSGSQDDGVAGLAAVVANGGVAVVQDPASALHTSMPSAAIRKVAVDHVVPPAKIGRLIGDLVTIEEPDDGPDHNAGLPGEAGCPE